MFSEGWGRWHLLVVDHAAVLGWLTTELLVWSDEVSAAESCDDDVTLLTPVSATSSDSDISVELPVSFSIIDHDVPSARTQDPSIHPHTRTTVQWPLIRVYPGRPVPEETFTHSHPSRSSDILYQLPPFTTIHSILFVQFTCLTVLFDKLSPGPHWSSSWSWTLYFILHTFLHVIIIIFSQHMPSPSIPIHSIHPQTHMQSSLCAAEM